MESRGVLLQCPAILLVRFLPLRAGTLAVASPVRIELPHTVLESPGRGPARTASCPLVQFRGLLSSGECGSIRTGISPKWDERWDRAIVGHRSGGSIGRIRRAAMSKMLAAVETTSATMMSSGTNVSTAACER